MAQKLMNLRVKKVDFVDEGANPRADIKLFKRRSPEEGEGLDMNDMEHAADSIAKRIAEALAGIFKKNSPENVEKSGAVSFKDVENTVNTEKIRDEIWSVCYALQQSLGSIVSDAELDAASALDRMLESIQEFSDTAKDYASAWAAGDVIHIQKCMEPPDSAEMPMLMTAYQEIGSLIEKSKSERQEQKGELEEMQKIDKSKMTPEEKAAYEEIVKKYAVEQEELDGEVDETDDEEKNAVKGCGGKEPTKKSLSQNPEEDIYKGLHPAVKAEIESLRKFREDAETRELTQIAKKYEMIGKKPEELVPTLKSLRAAGGTAYEDMIAILDSTLAAVQQSGVFGEIGKSREGILGADRDNTIKKVREQAAEIKKTRPELSMAQAMDEAMLANPEFLAELDK